MKRARFSPQFIKLACAAADSPFRKRNEWREVDRDLFLHGLTGRWHVCRPFSRAGELTVPWLESQDSTKDDEAVEALSHLTHCGMAESDPKGGRCVCPVSGLDYGTSVLDGREHVMGGFTGRGPVDMASQGVYLTAKEMHASGSLRIDTAVSASSNSNSGNSKKSRSAVTVNSIGRKQAIGAAEFFARRKHILREVETSMDMSACEEAISEMKMGMEDPETDLLREDFELIVKESLQTKAVNLVNLLCASSTRQALNRRKLKRCLCSAADNIKSVGSDAVRLWVTLDHWHRVITQCTGIAAEHVLWWLTKAGTGMAKDILILDAPLGTSPNLGDQRLMNTKLYNSESGKKWVEDRVDQCVKLWMLFDQHIESFRGVQYQFRYHCISFFLALRHNSFSAMRSGSQDTPDPMALALLPESKDLAEFQIVQSAETSHRAAFKAHLLALVKHHGYKLSDIFPSR